MAKFKFNAAQRWAVFDTHGARCYLCTKPIDLKSFQVDHIIPESLIDRPTELTKVLEDFGLAPTFNLNSYENWMPACPPCNNTKRDTVFSPAPIIKAQFQKAGKKAAVARRVEGKAITNAQLMKAMNVVERATSASDFDMDLLRPLVLAYVQRRPELLASLRRESDSYTVEYFVSAPPEELPITPFYKILFWGEFYEIVETSFGVGYVPTAPNLDRNFHCGHCGSIGPWNGARCLACGMLDDGA